MARKWIPIGVLPEIRAAEDGSPLIEGVAAVFDVETVIGGVFRERIAPGAFEASLGRGDEVVGLFNHNDDRVLGRRSRGTLRVWADDRGLRYAITLNPKDPEALSTLAKIERGDVTGSSFAFHVEDGGDELLYPGGDELPIRTLRALRLVDVSPVTFPAYPVTTVAARALGDADAEVLERLRNARANGGAAELAAARLRLAKGRAALER